MKSMQLITILNICKSMLSEFQVLLCWAMCFVWCLGGEIQWEWQKEALQLGWVGREGIKQMYNKAVAVRVVIEETRGHCISVWANGLQCVGEKIFVNEYPILNCMKCKIFKTKSKLFNSSSALHMLTCIS